MSSIKKLEKIKKLERIYYSPKGYWRGFSAIKRLSAAAKVSEEEAKNWLKNKQYGKFIFLHQNIFHARS